MRTSKVCIAALAGALAMASAVSGAESPAAPPARIELPESSPLLGGWAGSVGEHKVVVCFGLGQSSYFYVSHRAAPPLALSAQDAAGKNWREMEVKGAERKITGNWALDGPDGGRVRGTWSDPAGKKSLRIVLEKAGQDGTCDLAALLTKAGQHPEQIEAGKEAVQDGIRYRVLSSLDGTVSTIELLDAGGKYSALDKKLREGLKQDTREGEDCQTNATMRSGLLGWPYESKTTLEAVHGGRWITLRRTISSYCGGAHPIDESFSYTVDTRSGETLNISSWLKKDGAGELPKKLNEIIGQQAMAQRGGGEDDDCAEVYGSSSRFPGYTVWLGKDGLVFQKDLPRVVLACTEEVRIPFSKLQPYLTREGKEAVKLLSGD